MSVTTATAIITATVAILVAIITWQEWMTNRARLRHELFERRYAVYEQIRGFISTVLQSGDVTDEEFNEFGRKTKTAYFIFSSDIQIKELIKDINDSAAKLHALKETLNTTTGQERKRNVEGQTAIRKHLMKINESMEQRFEKYLKLVH